MGVSSGPSVDVAHLWTGGPMADAQPRLTSGSPGAVAHMADMKAPRASLAPPESSQLQVSMTEWASRTLSLVPLRCKMPKLQVWKPSGG